MLLSIISAKLHGVQVDLLANARHAQEDGVFALQGGGPGKHAAVPLRDVPGSVSNAERVMFRHRAGASFPDGGAQRSHSVGASQIVAAVADAVPHGDNAHIAQGFPPEDGIVAHQAAGLEVGLA